MENNLIPKQTIKVQLKQIKVALKTFSNSIVYKHCNNQELDWYKTELEIQVNFLNSKLKA